VANVVQDILLSGTPGALTVYDYSVNIVVVGNQWTLASSGAQFWQGVMWQVVNGDFVENAEGRLRVTLTCLSGSLTQIKLMASDSGEANTGVPVKTPTIGADTSGVALVAPNSRVFTCTGVRFHSPGYFCVTNTNGDVAVVRMDLIEWSPDGVTWTTLYDRAWTPVGYGRGGMTTDVSIVRGDYVSFVVTGLGSLENRTDLRLTVKLGDEDSDNDAILAWSEASGLTRLNAAAATASDGTLTVDDEDVGIVTVTLKADSSCLLSPRSGLFWDIQAWDANGPRTLASGAFAVQADITRSV
jgi:hypothetical protein